MRSKIRYLLLTVAVALYTASWGQNSITEREYWLDGNYAARQTMPQSVATVDISTLHTGAHTLTMRVKDNNGVWSCPVTQYFVIPRPMSPKASSIAEREYWIDGDFSNRQTLPLSVATLNISTLHTGAHKLTIRVMDDLGVWSIPVTQYFIILPKYVQTEPTIAHCMYWFDDNMNDFTTVNVEEDQNVVTLDVSGLTAGPHTIYWRVGDSNGAWSDKIYSSFFRYTVPNSGIGTFSNDVALVLPDGLSSHFTTADVMKNEVGQLCVIAQDIEGSVIPANTGLLMTGENNATYTLIPTDEEGPAIEGNALIAVVESTHVPQIDGDFTNFMLKSGKFIKIAEDEEDVKMPAYRAYLQLPTDKLSGDAGVNGITISWDGTIPSGIDDTLASPDETQPSVVYDLQGRRISAKSATKGIYIVNGKKVIKP